MRTLKAVADADLQEWEKNETCDGIPYYVHHRTEHTQWDHPAYPTLLEDLVNCNHIKFAAYRTATKLRTMQKFLNWHYVELPQVMTIINRHKRQHPQSKSMITCKNVAVIIDEILKISFQDSCESSGLQRSADLTLNVFLNIYNRKRNIDILLSSAQVFLVVMCSGKLQDKYKYLHHQLCDHNNCLPKSHITLLLEELLKIPEFLSEGLSFSKQLVFPTLASCLGTQKTTRLGLTEDEFLEWLLHEPQSLVWLPTLSRMITAETVQHRSKCCICKMCPIVGLRYQCLRCFNYNICQHCFFNGETSKNHKLNHPLREYCNEVDAQVFWEILRNKLIQKTINQTKQRYLPIPAYQQSTLVENGTGVENQHDMTVEVETGTTDHQSYSRVSNDCQTTMCHERLNPQDHRELESIVVHLEEENRQLQRDIEELHTNAGCARSTVHFQKEFAVKKQSILEDHSHQLELQLRRLRSLLKKYAQSLSSCTDENRIDIFVRQNGEILESTPITSCNIAPNDLDILSPITKLATRNNSWNSSGSCHLKKNTTANPDQVDSSLSTKIFPPNGLAMKNCSIDDDDDLSLSALISQLNPHDPNKLQKDGIQIIHLPPTPPSSSNDSYEHLETHSHTMQQSHVSFKDISEEINQLLELAENLVPRKKLDEPLTTGVEQDSLKVELDHILAELENFFPQMGPHRLETIPPSGDHQELLVLARDVGKILAELQCDIKS